MTMAHSSNKNRPKWRNSQAKKTLEQDILSGVVTDALKPKQVYEMHPEYKEFEIPYFRSNLYSMRKQHKEGKLGKQKPPKWSKSEAKKLLRDDIVVGVVTDDMQASDVYKMRDEFQLYKFDNFKTNLGNLRVSIKKNIERMQFDCICYGKDRALLIELRKDNPPNLPPYPIWHKHEAKKLLKQDISDGKHIDIKPQELWESRSEYMEFPLKVFRKHIYQELDERASKEYRFEKKKVRAPQPKQTEDQAAMLEAEK